MKSETSHSLHAPKPLLGIEVIFTSNIKDTIPDSSESIFLTVDEYLTNTVRLILNTSEECELLQNMRVPNISTNINALSERLINILLSRDFNYQSKLKVKHHIPRLRTVFAHHIATNRPIPFYYDLGGGYHAATLIDDLHTYTWDITLGELLALFQISRFTTEVVKLYPPGVRFHLIIDDGVANFINDIPLSLTRAYCTRFRRLINALRLSKYVSLLVQTEMCTWFDDIHNLQYSPKSRITETQHHNVMRFLGRSCSIAEAADRMGRHEAAIRHSEVQIQELVNGEVRLLQRSDDGMLTFRPFPGGATRIQCGRLGLLIQAAKLIPFLVTTKTRQAYSCISITRNLFDIISHTCSKSLALAPSSISHGVGAGVSKIGGDNGRFQSL